MSVIHGTGCFIEKEKGTVADPGEGPGGAQPRLFLDQNEARKAEKKFLGGHPPPLYQSLDDRAPP